MATTRVIVNLPWSKLIINDSDTKELGISETALKIARKELREDKNAREQSLQQLREWLKKNEDVQDIRTDDTFLLRFLRVKKFSVPMAEQMILKYLNIKKRFPEMACNLDFLDPKISQLFNQGYIFVSPVRDKQGRRVVIGFAKNFDPRQQTCNDMARAHFITYETLLEDVENQVVGINHIGDMRGISAAHITCWNPSDFGRILKWGEHSLPMRHKAIHCVFVPQAVKYVFEFASSVVSKKIKDRLHMHVNLEDLHKVVDKECLPAELGGKIPGADMIDWWKRELAAKRDLVMALDNMKLLSDRGIVTRHQKNDDLGLITGSFRKLEVD